MSSFGPLRVVLIGTGAIAHQMHLPVLVGHPDFTLIGVVDRDRARSKSTAQSFKVPRFADDISQLDLDQIDGVVIATPPAFHADIAISLMRHGKHVFVEKPIALTLKDAEEMVRVAEETRTVLSVGMFRRLFPSVRLLKGLIDSESIGPPRRFKVVGGGFYDWSAATLGGMRKESAGGGVLMDFGTHLIDIMLTLFNGPAQVAYYSDDADGGVEADCRLEATLTSTSHVVSGSMEFSRLRDLGSRIEVECDHGFLEFSISDRFQIRVVRTNNCVRDFYTSETTASEARMSWSAPVQDDSWYATFAEQYNDWLRAIRTGAEPMMSGRSSLATTRFIDDCYARKSPQEDVWVGEGVGDRSYPVCLRLSQRSRQRVLLTGASGFIGGRIAEALYRHGYEVRALVNNPANASRIARLGVEMVQADLTVADLAPLVRDCDAVVHCAVGTAYGRPDLIRRVTIDGTRRLAKTALKENVSRFVHLSSMSIYGVPERPLCVIDETSSHRATKVDFYGWTKYQAERVVLEAFADGLPTVILRPARVFGPFGKTFVMNPIRAISENRFGWLGDPNVPCDMVYVDNVVAACLRALESDGNPIVGKAFNVTDGESTTWSEFYGWFAVQLGRDASSWSTMPLHLQMSQSAFRSVLSWPFRIGGNLRELMTSSEMKTLGGRFLALSPLGTLPRELLNRSSWMERAARRLVGANDSPELYRPSTNGSLEVVRMGSAGETLSLNSSRNVLGYLPAVSRDESLAMTFQWLKHSRLVQQNEG